MGRARAAGQAEAPAQRAPSSALQSGLNAVQNAPRRKLRRRGRAYLLRLPARQSSASQPRVAGSLSRCCRRARTVGSTGPVSCLRTQRLWPLCPEHSCCSASVETASREKLGPDWDQTFQADPQIWLYVRGGRPDSNRRPPGPQPGALPTELRPPRGFNLAVTSKVCRKLARYCCPDAETTLDRRIQT